jgi:hypothetical protein
VTRSRTIRTRTKTKKTKLNPKLPQGDSKIYTVYVFTRIHGGCPVAVGFPFINARSQTADNKITNNQNPNKNQEVKAEHKAPSSRQQDHEQSEPEQKSRRQSSTQSFLKLMTRSRTIRTQTKIKKTKLPQADDKITNNQNPNKNQEDKAEHKALSS